MRSIKRHIARTCQNVLKCIFFPFLFSAALAFAGQDDLVVRQTPVVSSEHFPCTKCHGQNGTMNMGSKDKYHNGIQVEGHTEEQYSCFDCHDTQNLDRLVLFNGTRIDIAFSWKLCGQCHSINYALWKKGLHGKVFGKWIGPKEYAPCTACHNPHKPRYPTQFPAPPPTPPEQTLRWQK